MIIRSKKIITNKSFIINIVIVKISIMIGKFDLQMQEQEKKIIFFNRLDKLVIYVIYRRTNYIDYQLSHNNETY